MVSHCPKRAATPHGRHRADPRDRRCRNRNSHPVGWLFLNGVRRRPTLPHSLPCSTIGAEGLSFRVRNGTGRFPFAMTAVTLWRYSFAVRDRISRTAQWTRSTLKGVSSCRQISTGQLRESLVLTSTSGLSTQWSRWVPLGVKPHGNLISKQASRLDAFSGYPFRT
jgi:hypothetical protein